MENQWSFYKNPQSFTKNFARTAWEGRRGYGRGSRQSERENDRKGGFKGYDGGKKIKGRKRHIVVDTLGFIIGVVISAASCTDREGLALMFYFLRGKVKWPKLMWADGGYSGDEMARIAAANGVELEIVKRNHKKGDGFVVQAKRWIVERTFGWLGRYRRFSKDYEYLTSTSECMIYLGMSRIMVRRIAKLV